LNKYKKEQRLNFQLLGDFNKTASAAFDVLDDTLPAFRMREVSKRAAFVIDKASIIQYAEIAPHPAISLILKHIANSSSISIVKKR